MRHELWGVPVAAVALVMAGLRIQAAEAVVVPEPGTSIVVRTYTQPSSGPAMRTARRTAGAILARADIRVVWIECGVPAAVAAGGGDAVRVASPAADACTRPLARNELVLRILPAGMADSRPNRDALGFAFVDVGAGGGWLATVYSDRVGTLAQAAGVDAAELLGRAMAHEIGHLLLGTNRHAPDGLMRASWSGADLRRNRATSWLFGGQEGEAMRRRIASRS